MRAVVFVLKKCHRLRKRVDVADDWKGMQKKWRAWYRERDLGRQ